MKALTFHTTVRKLVIYIEIFSCAYFDRASNKRNGKGIFFQLPVYSSPVERDSLHSYDLLPTEVAAWLQLTPPVSPFRWQLKPRRHVGAGLINVITLFQPHTKYVGTNKFNGRSSSEAVEYHILLFPAVSATGLEVGKPNKQGNFWSFNFIGFRCFRYVVTG